MTTSTNMNDSILNKINSTTDVPLTNKALLVRLICSKLNRNRLDKKLSAGVIESNNVKNSAAIRVNKSLFSKEATDGYMKIMTQARKYYYTVTLPWDTRGRQLLPIDLYKDFVKRMNQYVEDFRVAVNEFVDQVDQHMAAARDMLGDAFNMDDYPFISESGTVDRELLLEQFNMQVEFDTITDTNDIRANLTDVDKEIIAQNIEQQQAEKFTKAQEHIATLLKDHVMAIYERLSDVDNVFRDTLIGNLRDLVALIPKMNLAGDPAINQIAKDAKEKLASYDPQDLRDDVALRDKVARDAKGILDNMQGIL